MVDSMYFKWLLAIFFFEYFRPGNNIPLIGALKIGTILPLSLVVTSIIKKEYYSYPTNKEFLRSNDTKWIGYFLFLIFISVLSADVTLYSYNVFKVVFGYFLLYFLLFRWIQDENELKWLIIILLFCHLLLLLLNPDVILNPSTRSYLNHAYLGDGNDFSLSLCILFPLVLYLYMQAKRIKKIIFIGIMLVIIFSVIGTQSRGGTLALSCIVLYFWWHSSRKTLGIIMILICITIVLAYAPGEYFNRMQTIYNYQDEGSALGRLTVWKASLRMVADHPFLGVGAGHFPVKYGAEYYPPEAGPGPWLTAHSIYFLILGELGIPGIVFLLVVIFGNLLKNEKSIQKTKNGETKKLLICINASIIGYAVGGAFLSALYYPHIFVLLGIKNAAENIIKKRLP